MRPGAFLSLIGGMDGAHCTTQKTHLQAEQPAQFPTQQYSCADNGDAEKEHILAAAKEEENVVKYLENGVKKEIYVPGKLVNFVV